MTVVARHLGELLRGALGLEVFFGAQNYMPMPLIPLQPNTIGWVMTGPAAFSTDSDIGTPAANAKVLAEPGRPIGVGAAAPGHESMAIQVGSISLPATYYFRGVSASENAQSSEETLPGARRLAFHVASDIGDNPTLVLDIYGRTNLGKDVIERLILSGLTNTKQAGWTAWSGTSPSSPAGNNFHNNIAPAPVSAAFYNPNSGGSAPNNLSLGAGGSAVGDANWARLPVVPAFQTKNAWSRLYKMAVLSRTGTSADTLLVPVMNTLDFGLRHPIHSIDDIRTGGVLCFPIVQFLANVALPLGSLQSVTALANYPLWNPLHRRAINIEPDRGIVSFTRTSDGGAHPTGVKNPHVVSGRTTKVDMIGEMFPAFFDHPWILVLGTAAGKKAA